MKNSILCCFAAVALALSYFYEVAPEPTAPNSQNPVFESASIVPLPFDGNESSSPFAKATQPLTFKDSLFYHYYSQNFAVNLDYSEDKALLETVSEWIGTPYRSGSSTRKGTDCSGFVSAIYRQVYGINLTHSSRSMFQEVERIKKDSMRTGDLVFFRRSPKQPIYHVGIYLKDGKFVHSASNGGVMISSLRQPYYQRNFYAAGRVN
jgi:probable lipoprotein NlpC